jgi:hypothetical protein
MLIKKGLVPAISVPKLCCLTKQDHACQDQNACQDQERLPRRDHACQDQNAAN